jgi:ABC-2 type transport system permease protein
VSALVHPTVVRLSRRSLFGRRRGVLLFLLPLALIGFAGLIRLLVGAGEAHSEVVLFGLGLAVVVPLVALVAGTGVLGPEVDDGSIIYLLAKPVSRHSIVVSKALVAMGSVALFAGLGMLVAGVALQAPDLEVAIGYAAGALTGGVAYTALFVLLSVLTRHAVVVGLVYVLIWEGLLGGLLDGVRWLSIRQWSAAVTAEVSGEVSVRPDLGLVYALVATAVVTVASLVLAGERLRSFRLTGEE